jgi:glycosyltransferase involved in cell wall biosynthesis
LVPRLAEALEHAWRAQPPDVVHAHGWMSGLAAVAAARASQVPVVLTAHGLGCVGADRARISAEQVVARRADRIVATSEEELVELVRRGAPRRAVTVVPTGVDLAAFSADGPAAARGERPRLLTVAGAPPADGVGDVIAAAAAVPAAELLVVGGTARDGAADRVRVVDAAAGEDLPALLRSADVVVCAPWREALGTLALQAMACGRAVVATAVGGLRDAVVPGVTGLQVPPRDPARLAHALRGMLADRAMPMAYGIAGRDRVESRYGWPRIVEATVAVYRQVLDGRGAGRPAARGRPLRG